MTNRSGPSHKMPNLHRVDTNLSLLEAKIRELRTELARRRLRELA